MKVKEIITYLQGEYDPEDHLIIDWWSRGLFQKYNAEANDYDTVSVEDWNAAAEALEGEGWTDQIGQDIIDFINTHLEIVRKRKETNNA